MPPIQPQPLTKKILESGLIDRKTAEMLEAWKALPEGSADLVREDALKDATREQLVALSNELEVEVEKQFHMRETAFDLERIRWPVTITIYRTGDDWPGRTQLVAGVTGVQDRMGRYYFQIGTVKKEWLVPGYQFERTIPHSGSESGLQVETILEHQQLHAGDQPICWQVSTRKEKSA